MERGEERLEESQVRSLSTVELVRLALNETRLLVRAEVLHARHELKEEVLAARTSGILLGAALTLSLCGLSLLFVTVAMALPIAAWLASLIVGVVLLLVAGGLGFAGYKRLPKKPLPDTQERLKADFALTREELQ